MTNGEEPGGACVTRAGWVAPATLFVLTLAVRLVPWNRTLISWDEWIPTTISTRVALWWLPQSEVYDILVPAGYSCPPFFFWLGGLCIYWFGSVPLVWRLPTILSDAGCAAMAYILGRRVGGRWTGWTAGLLSWAALYLNFDHTVTMDFLLSFWVLLSTHLYLRSAARNSRILLWASIFVAGLACFTKYHGVVFMATLCALVVLIPKTRAMVQGKRLLMFGAVAFFFPCLMLATEWLTWRFYGFPKTHTGEVLRMFTWTPYAVDPISGELVQPAWHYYFVYGWVHLGPLICLLAAAGCAVALAAGRNRDKLVLAVIVAVWMTWMSIADFKHARYVLPMMYMFFIFIGILFTRLAQARYGRWLAGLLLVATVATSLWGTMERLRAYIEEAARHERVYEVVNTKTPEDAVVLAESLPFQAGQSEGIAPIKRKIIDPANDTWNERADYLIADDSAFRLLRVGGVPAQEDYLDQREKLVREWEPLLDVGEGPKRLRVLKKVMSAE